MDPLITQLVKQIRNNDPRLRHVSLRSLPLLEVSNEEIFAVVESLQYNAHVCTFDMSLHHQDNPNEAEAEAADVPMDEFSATHLIPAPFETIFAKNSSLVDVRISSSCCFLLASVFRGLSMNKSVQVLQVGEMTATGDTTNMTFHCSQALQAMLERNNTIHRLALQGFRWEDKEALKRVCCGLRTNKALMVLELLQIVVAARDDHTLNQVQSTEETDNINTNEASPAADLAIPFDEQTGYKSKQMEAAEAHARALMIAKAEAATNLMNVVGSMRKLKRLCVNACELSEVTFPDGIVDVTAAFEVVSDLPKQSDNDSRETPENEVLHNKPQELVQEPQLEELRLVECQLTGLSIFKLQQGCGYTYPLLKTLDVRSNALDNDSCEFLARILRSATSLSKVILEDNNIGDEGLTVLCEKGLQDNSTLRQLCLKDNDFGPRGVQILANVLRGNRSIQSVDLSYNFVGDVGAVALGGMLQHNSVLVDLVLENATIQGRGIEGLCQGIRKSEGDCTLKRLNLSGNTFGSTGVAALCSLLAMEQQIEGRAENGSDQCSLVSLRLASCNLGDAGVAALAKALEQNSQLEEVVLPFNRFGDEGARVIGQSIPKWKGLTSLQIQFNLFGEAGFAAIVQGLAKNCFLKSLYLLNAGPSNRCLDELFQEMQHWIRLNRAGRRVLSEPVSLPSSIWPHVYARASKIYSADGLYFLLRQKPDVARVQR